jgi:hypothetical protein
MHFELAPHMDCPRWRLLSIDNFLVPLEGRNA